MQQETTEKIFTIIFVIGIAITIIFVFLGYNIPLHGL